MRKLEELKQKFDKKIDNEYKEFIKELKQCSPDIIIERAYEKVSKEEMIYKIKEKNYTVSDLKALLKSDDLLDECYDEWLKSDGNFNELLEYPVEERIDLIIDDYRERKQKETER